MCVKQGSMSKKCIRKSRHTKSTSSKSGTKMRDAEKGDLHEGEDKEKDKASFVFYCFKKPSSACIFRINQPNFIVFSAKCSTKMPYTIECTRNFILATSDSFFLIAIHL